MNVKNFSVQLFILVLIEMNRVFEDFSYDTGPESLPCHHLHNNNNSNNNNFQSKYLFFNGLGATLPRRPKRELNSRKADTEVRRLADCINSSFIAIAKNLSYSSTVTI